MVCKSSSVQKCRRWGCEWQVGVVVVVVCVSPLRQSLNNEGYYSRDTPACLHPLSPTTSQSLLFQPAYHPASHVPTQQTHKLVTVAQCLRICL